MSKTSITIKVHRIAGNGTLNSSRLLEIDSLNQVTKKTDVKFADIQQNPTKYLPNWEYQEEMNSLYPNFGNHMHAHHYLDTNITMTLIKLGEVDEINATNYITKLDLNNNNDPLNCEYEFTATDRQQEKRLKLPDSSVISCQNCDTSFPTKYQFQRHQCEFNAEKVVLKAEVAGKDIDKATRLRFECDVCKKSFVSHNNLERHKNCHKSKSNNICEFCSKTFVSENRLKIHKENHCKKAGDTTKFYRSDVVVWRCEQCKQVFATQESGNKHIKLCTTVLRAAHNNDEDGTKVLEDANNITNITSICEDNNFDCNFEKAMTSQTSDTNNNNNNNNNNESSSVILIKIITEMLFQCEFCNRTYAAKSSVLTHQKMHSTEKNYECIFCQQYFDGYSQATAHWQNKCSDESNLFYLPKMVYCEHCDRGFKSHEILYNHKNKKKHFTPKIHHNNNTTAKTTTNATKAENEKAIVKLIENMISKMDHDAQSSTSTNNDNNNPDDVIPLASIKTENDTSTTTTTPSNNSNNEVQENGKKKRGRKRKWQKTEMKNKKFIMEDGCQYQCERCAQCFESISALDSHKDSSHVSTYRCEQCGQIVHSSKALMIHSRAHQSLKPYVCDQCGRSYSQTSHLWQHMRFHQGIKPFACPHEGCEARYTIRPDLKDHIRKVHTRERPFKCSVCNKCFLTGSVYYQHRLIHTNDRRYGCDICNKRFFRADALNNHRRIHTDERPYPCPVCGREFRQKGDRNKHVRTQHPM